MQVIIPLAGKGTRLRPHTHLVPKPLLKVAGRPVMDWVMDRLDGLDVSELIFITGHLKEQVEAYARARYPIPVALHRAEGAGRHRRRRQPGAAVRARAGAHHLRRHGVRGRSHADQPDRRRRDHLGQGGGGLPALRRGGHRHAGLHDADRREAVDARSRKLANIGLYYIRAVDSLWQGIDHVLARPKNKGEYFLTDAFQWMIEHGKRILTAEVGGWYDCGKLGHAARDQRDPAPQGRGAPAGVSRRHHPRSGLHRGRRHDRAERDRPQRLARAGHAGRRQPARQHHRGPRCHAHARAARRRHAGQRRHRRGARRAAPRWAITRRWPRSPACRAVEPDSMEPDAVCRRALPVLPGPQVPLRPGRRERGRAGGARRPARPLRRRPPCGRTSRRSGRWRARSRSSTSTTCRRRSTAPRCWASSGARSSGWSTSGRTSGTRSSGSTISSRGCTRCWRGTRRGRRAGRPRRSSGSARSRPSSTRRARRCDEPPSVFVDSALAHAGWRRRAHRAARRRDGRRGAGAAPTSCGPRGGQALEALKRFGTALRDEIEPAADPARLRDRRGAVRPPAALRARRRGRRARALALRPPPAGGDRRPSSRRSPPSSAPRPWRELVDELRNDAPATGELLDVYRAELGPRARLRGGAGPGGDSRHAARRGRHAAVPRVAGAVRGLRAAADLSRRPARPVLRHRARPVAAGRGGGAAAPRDTAATAFRRWWRTRRIPGHHLQLVTAQELAVRGAAPSLDADHGRGMGALLRAAPGRGGLLPDARAATLPAGEPALARHPGRARRRTPHAGDDAGRGGGLHGGAPADRAAERGGRGAPLLRVAHLPALLRRRSPRAAAAARGLAGGHAGRTSIRAGSTIRC